jgi:hypothetical protein
LQIRLVPPPSSVNPYANKTTYATSSRWCQATAPLSNGKTDTSTIAFTGVSNSDMRADGRHA